MYEKEFSTDVSHVIVHVTRQSRNMGVRGTARLGAECSLFHTHSELQRLFETEGAGEGEISLIARGDSQAGLFSELKAWRLEYIRKSGKKKGTRRGSDPRPSAYEADAMPLSYKSVRDRLGRHVGTWSESLKVCFFFFVASL